jgi:phosphate transport system substrate-binding protein
LRTEILPPARDSDVVRDERNRHFYGGDFDFAEYIPFSENNKLVKIESPPFVIDSEHPKIHGAFAFYPVYAAVVEATYRNTEKFKFNSRSYPGELVLMTGTSPDAFGTLLGGKNLLGGNWFESDMIFMLQPSEKQLQEAKDKGIELVITPIGYEAFVFFVSTVNPVDELSLDQIRDIYSKKITRWEDVGGKRERILPFQRPEGSGSQTAMLRVMGDVPIAPPQREEFRQGMGEIVADVADYRNYGNAIGFSFRYYVEGLFKHDGVKLLKIDGIAPTIENVQNKTYPEIGELVIISRKNNTNPHVPTLTDWFLSPQGQELIKNVGYVPLQ